MKKNKTIKTQEEFLLEEKARDNYRIMYMEKAKLENKIHRWNNLDECLDRLMNVSIFYASHNLDAWDYFINIYNDIPQEYRLKVMLLGIYTGYHFRIPELYDILAKILNYETEEQRKCRMKENKKALKKYFDKENFITLYRGVNGKSLDEEYAISYTVDKSKAIWFANRFQDEFSEVIEEEFHLNGVLLYTNNRKEEEVMVIPRCIEC